MDRALLESGKRSDAAPTFFSAAGLYLAGSLMMPNGNYPLLPNRRLPRYYQGRAGLANPFRTADKRKVGERNSGNGKAQEIANMSIRVKICGITRVEDALAAVRFGANAIGFVFWKKSARYVTPAKAQEIIAALPPFITAVGVYVDPDPDWVEETFSVASLNLLQFHGNEDPGFCRQFSRPYIKAMRVRASVDLLQYATRYTGAGGLLLDTYVEDEPGGTGHAFDWNLIPKELPLPLILSG